MNNKIYKIAVSGLLIALSIALSRAFSANIMIAGIPAVRLAVGFVPIMLASIILGPYYGVAIGAMSDIIGYIVFPIGPYFFGITITSALVGLIPYVVFCLSKNMRLLLKVLIAIAVTQISCSVLLQTFWLSILYGKAYEVLFYPRAITVLITIPIYYALIYPILIGLAKGRLMPNNDKVARQNYYQMRKSR